jgi:Domain of unknown function (DUF5615)
MDSEIWELAKSQDLCIVTQDADFAEKRFWQHLRGIKSETFTRGYSVFIGSSTTCIAAMLAAFFMTKPAELDKY